MSTWVPVAVLLGLPIALVAVAVAAARTSEDAWLRRRPRVLGALGAACFGAAALLHFAEGETAPWLRLVLLVGGCASLLAFVLLRGPVPEDGP